MQQAYFSADSDRCHITGAVLNFNCKIFYTISRCLDLRSGAPVGKRHLYVYIKTNLPSTITVKDHNTDDESGRRATV